MSNRQGPACSAALNGVTLSAMAGSAVPTISAANGAESLHVSVVIPLYNERATVEEVCRRTAAALASTGSTFEVICVDDGSTDGTFALVEQLRSEDARIRGLRLARNFGQHPAVRAGLERARGEVLVTIDGDLQNAPEDVPKLVAAVDAGSDVASGRRAIRRDSWLRRGPSRLINTMLRRFTGVEITDFGCALNAYRRSAVQPVLGAVGRQRFTKALVLSTGASVVEIDVAHAPRGDRSRYSRLGLSRQALHVLAAFWPQPIQWIGIALGLACTLVAGGLTVYGIVFWILRANFPGPLLAGTGVIFILGVQGFILALVGEYLGRLLGLVEGRPVYTVERELE
jgi:undecaprenyl-phosphate 4-deoxy-4-formamido-L-arabinose transferase